MTKVILFLSSTRVGASYTGTGSWGDRVGALAKERFEAAGCTVTVWDPKKIEFPMLQQPIQMIPDKSTVPQVEEYTPLQSYFKCLKFGLCRLCRLCRL